MSVKRSTSKSARSPTAGIRGQARRSGPLRASCAAGELVKAKITRTRKRHAFADAVTILRAAPERVVAPCKYAGPGGCGGCDFQHVELETQRAFKQQVIEEQLQRLAGIDLRVPVVAIPGDGAGLRWRTRMRYVELPDGGRGLRQYHSHQVVEIDDCLIARSDAREPTKGTVRETVTHDDVKHEFRVDGRGFWQVHRGAPTALVAAVIEGAQPKPGRPAGISMPEWDCSVPSWPMPWAWMDSS
ncbi:MAG: hypothetical protein R2709_04300 [Marmoricola sp.]